eukprot:1265941-Prorocentrum_lima.AAC.1
MRSALPLMSFLIAIVAKAALANVSTQWNRVFPCTLYSIPLCRLSAVPAHASIISRRHPFPCSGQWALLRKLRSVGR